MAQALDILTTSAIGALVSFVVASLTAAAQSRTKVDDSIRERRTKDYQELWRLTVEVPKWPRASLTKAQLVSLSSKLKDWYFSGGGMYLSAVSARVYKKLQETITDVTSKATTDAIADDQYDRVQRASSALRTELTNDLLSRSQSLWVRPFRWRLR